KRYEAMDEQKLAKKTAADSSNQALNKIKVGIKAYVSQLIYAPDPKIVVLQELLNFPTIPLEIKFALIQQFCINEHFKYDAAWAYIYAAVFCPSSFHSDKEEDNISALIQEVNFLKRNSESEEGTHRRNLSDAFFQFIHEILGSYKHKEKPSFF